jgi:hypothetical protein
LSSAELELELEPRLMRIRIGDLVCLPTFSSTLSACLVAAWERKRNLMRAASAGATSMGTTATVSRRINGSLRARDDGELIRMMPAPNASDGDRRHSKGGALILH